MVTGADVAVGLLNGVTWGLVLALIALGLGLILGLLEVVNLAHGSLYMLGAVTTWFVVDATGSFLLALAVAPIAVGALGAAIERAVLRPIEDDVSVTLIATFGLMLMLQQVALLVFGPGSRGLPSPVPGQVHVEGVSYPKYRLAIGVVAVALLVGLGLLLRRTRFGLWMRGVRQDREMARALGIPLSRVYMFTFGLGAALAALAGALLAPVVSVDHLMGLDVLAVAFIVVIVGGLGSMRGVLAASVVYASVENLGSIVVSPVEAQLLALALMIALVVARPEGILEGS